MDHSPANKLPEADSLPDGFVESSIDPPSSTSMGTDKEAEPLDYKERTLKQPEPLDYKESTLKQPQSLDYKESALLEVGHSSAVDSLTVEPPQPKHECSYLAVNDLVHVSGNAEAAEKTEKPRTFPVPLFEKDGSELDGNSEVNDESNMPQVGHNPPEGLMRTLSSNTAFMVNSSSGLGNVEEDSQNAEQQSTEECFEQQSMSLGERSEPGSAACQNNKKLGSSSDVKRKPTKRSVKAEKELLEFTLKYQKAIAERDAAIAVRDKLESLCRELQRQNKILMEECKRVSVEGQNMRSDLSTKFHVAIKDVSNKLEEQKDECLSQLKENEMLRNKLKQLADQYAVSEEQFQQKLKQKMLELQLADLKIQQHQEKSAQDQTQMKLYGEQVSQLLATEKNLRLQLQADGEKFQQFQDALLKSNEVFEAFKKEMEKMAKSMKELKKENMFLKGKCEKTDVSLIELVEERVVLKKQVEKVKNQKYKLESLCRSLQAERKQNPSGSSPDALSNPVRASSGEEESQ